MIIREWSSGPALCLYRYGNRRQLICKRLAGHAGHHAVRMTVQEMLRDLRPRPRKRGQR